MPAPRGSPQASTFVSDRFVTSTSQAFVAFLWAELCEKLKSRSIEDALSMKDEVNKVIGDLKDISKSGLFVLEDALKSFFQGAEAFQDFKLQVGSTFTEEAHSEMLSSIMARKAGVNSQIEEKEKILESLQKRKQEICALIEREDLALKSFQSDMSALDEDLTSLNNSRPLSKEDEDKLNRMKVDLETQKQELGGLRVTF